MNQRVIGLSTLVWHQKTGAPDAAKAEEGSDSFPGDLPMGDASGIAADRDETPRQRSVESDILSLDEGEKGWSN